MKRLTCFFIFILSYFKVIGQQDAYDSLKTQYDRFRKEENHDSALYVARQMNAWALKNETDTSLRYAVSMRYLGNCFNRLNEVDSAICFIKRSLDILSAQNRELTDNFTITLRNLGNLYVQIEKFEDAIKQFEKTISVYLKMYPDSLSKQAFIFDNIGEIYKITYDYKKSMENLNTAEKLFAQNVNAINQINSCTVF